MAPCPTTSRQRRTSRSGGRDSTSDRISSPRSRTTWSGRRAPRRPPSSARSSRA